MPFNFPTRNNPAGSTESNQNHSSPTPTSSTISLAARVGKLSRAMIISVFVAVIAIGFAVYALVSTNLQINATRAGMTAVVVASGDIAPGQTIEASNLTVKEVPQQYVVGNASGSIEPFVGKTAISKITNNSQIVPSMVAGINNGSSLSGSLASDRKAVTISVDEASGIAGLLHVGDQVSVVATGASIGNGSATPIASNSHVIALGSNMSSSDSSYASVTVEVSDSEALAIRNAQANGSVSIILDASVNNSLASQNS